MFNQIINNANRLLIILPAYASLRTNTHFDFQNTFISVQVLFSKTGNRLPLPGNHLGFQLAENSSQILEVLSPLSHQTFLPFVNTTTRLLHCILPKPRACVLSKASEFPKENPGNSLLGKGTLKMWYLCLTSFSLALLAFLFTSPKLRDPSLHESLLI